MKKSLFLILLMLMTLKLSAQLIRQNLDGNNWYFRQSTHDQWLPTSVPGCVHQDLLRNGLIQNPFFADNEKKTAWIDSCEWEYKTTFSIDAKMMQQKRIRLIFQGLDTYATIYLNGSPLGTASNMFRCYEFDCGSMLKEGENELIIHFSSTLMQALNAYQSLDKPLAYDERVMVRKAQYQFGWDWGPRFLGCGIWKKVELIGDPGLRIETLKTDILYPDEKKSEIKFVINASCSVKSKASVSLILDSIEVKKQSVNLQRGNNVVEIQYVVKNPELWWPAGMGKQKLYPFSIKIENKEGNHDEAFVRIGLRKIELVQEADSIGKSFLFRINGQPLFIKGANVIPEDVFPALTDSSKRLRLLNDASESHINMLRVWGGGIYEDDYFYQLCDEKGILIWQDFMFACHLYPADTAFLQNVKEEVRQQTIRIGKHPCLALWCGNNEIDEGWKNWGMQQQFNYDSLDSVRLWNDYLGIFDTLIPSVLQEYGADIPYVASSPLHGWGRAESMTEGDAHYWGVWWGDEAFDVYNKKVPRFMSEYGFQGFPDTATLNAVLPLSERYLFSNSLKNHEKHPRGFELISAAMQRDYWQTSTYENFALLSQIIQADAIQTAIEAHRRARPFCMGSLYWQLNDCWPVISWSGVDYYGRWKAAQYAVKRGYRDIILSLVKTKGEFQLFAVSDTTCMLNADLKFKIFSNEGTLIYQKQTELKLQPGSTELISSFKPLLSPSIDTTKAFIFAEIVSGGKSLAGICRPLCKPVNYQQPPFKVKINYSTSDSLNTRMELITDVPVLKAIIISSDPDDHFSDNYLDLFPWSPSVIEIKTKGYHQRYFVTSLYKLKD